MANHLLALAFSLQMPSYSHLFNSRQCHISCEKMPPLGLQPPLVAHQTAVLTSADGAAKKGSASGPDKILNQFRIRDRMARIAITWLYDWHGGFVVWHRFVCRFACVCFNQTINMSSIIMAETNRRKPSNLWYLITIIEHNQPSILFIVLCTHSKLLPKLRKKEEKNAQDDEKNTHNKFNVSWVKHPG